MIESSFIFLISLLGAFLIFILKNREISKLIALFSVSITFFVTLYIYLQLERNIDGFQFVTLFSWIPQWALHFSTGLDRLNAPFVLLTSFISLIVVLLSLKTIKDKLQSYLTLFLILSSSVNAFFISTNFLQFFFFYEAMLIPSVLLIQRWGGSKAREASMKFLIYTFGFSIFLFISIIAVYIYGGGFEFERLYSMNLSDQAKTLLFVGFLLGFLVKIPVVPFHGWLRDAYYESPMPVTIFLSAVLGKMGIYGILRVFPAFSDVMPTIGQWVILLCLISFIYAAFLALSERDLKVLFAYMSLSHVGIITAGALTGNIYGYQGALLQSINHGVLAATFFYIADLIHRNTATYDSEKFGQLAKKVPALTFFTFAFVMAMGGFPGLNYFNGELLLLSGIFKNNIIFGFLGVIGVAIGVVYLSWFFYRVFLRKPGGDYSAKLLDIGSWEFLVFVVNFFIVIYFGLNPEFILGGFKELLQSFGGRG